MKYICIVVLLILVVACANNPKVEIKTELGNLVVEVYQDKAPVTASNFLRYVDEKRYDGALFYRVVTKDNQQGDSIKIEVVQGGLYLDEHQLSLKPIEHETTSQTGILHEDGTISMGRFEPGTASSEFFICIGSQPGLDYGSNRNVDGQGFAAFGKVILGMDVINKIHSLDNTDQMLDKKLLIESVRRI